MKKSIGLILILAMAAVWISGCSNAGTDNGSPDVSGTASNGTNDSVSETDRDDASPESTEDHIENSAEDSSAGVPVKEIDIIVNGRKYEVSLYDNETAKSFAKTLPLTLEMKELNGNEKYQNLGTPLPSDSSRVERIACGDLMLYGSDCIVLFYKNFNTPYSYTKIGRINDPEGLEQALGTGSVTILFQRKGE